MKRYWMMFLDFVMEFTPLHYKVNHYSLEIHNLREKHKNCKTELISNWQYTDLKSVTVLLQVGYNGCRWCCPKWNIEE